MNIDIIISADDIKEEKILNKSVVVIDMLRATSTIVTAMSNGCEKVIPVLSPEEAFSISNENRDKYILGGERNALKIDGFDCSNSPLEYVKEVVNDKILIITTSNGTRAIKGSEKASHILIGSMLNAVSVAKRLKELKNDVVIVNAGTQGQFSMDDFICSGYIIKCLEDIEDNVQLTDISKAATYMYESEKATRKILPMAKHYEIVKNLGFTKDLEHCLKTDVYDIVPEYKEGEIS